MKQVGIVIADILVWMGAMAASLGVTIVAFYMMTVAWMLMLSGGGSTDSMPSVVPFVVFFVAPQWTAGLVKSFLPIAIVAQFLVEPVKTIPSTKLYATVGALAGILSVLAIWDFKEDFDYIVLNPATWTGLLAGVTCGSTMAFLRRNALKRLSHY